MVGPARHHPVGRHRRPEVGIGRAVGQHGGVTAADDLRDLTARYWEARLEESPLFATFLGDHRFDDRADDLSESGDAAQRAAWSGFAAEAAAIDPASLDETDRVTHRLLVEELDQALDALATLGVREAVPDIAPWAAHPDPYVHRAAARALVRLGGDAARDAVRDLLDADDASVRCTAAYAYGRLADDDTPLWPLIDDADPVVGLCARGALGRMGHDELLEPLTSAAVSGCRTIAKPSPS